jgi:hypothetical protein
MRHTKPLVIAAMTVGMAFTAGPAFALPGDRAIDSSSPFRLDGRNLEPGCFIPGRFSNADVDSHLTIGLNPLQEEMHITVEDGASYSVDQVLVPSPIDGYKIYSTFDTGTVNNDADIDPGQTATGMHSPTRLIDNRDVIVCISGHSDAAQNEPYQSEAGGLVSAKNRPILQPKVTAFGVSAISNLKTYKIGFGYTTEKWYVKPAFLDAEDHPLFIPTVTDPNALPSPTFGDNLPAFVSLFPRADNAVYDARRVNDVDKASEQWSLFGLPSVLNPPLANDNQSFLFGQAGDLTAWTDDPTARSLVFDGRNLITTLTQGDLPMKWTLRASLAASTSKRSATFTLADYFAWNKSWQDYYRGGKLPTLALAPGTNSPDPDPSITVVVNPVLTQPVPTPGNPNPPAVPVAPVSTAPVTVGGVTPAGGQAISNAVNANSSCTSTRVIKIRFAKSAKSAHIRFRGHTVQAKMVNGRLQATADMRGYKAHPGSLMKVTTLSRSKSGRVTVIQRVFKVC